MGMSKAARMMMMGRSDDYRKHGDYLDKEHGRYYDEHEKPRDYKKDHDYGKEIRAGGTFWMNSPQKDMKFDKETAEHWVSEMDKPEGGKGGKWTYDQTTQVMKQKGFNCDPVVFMAVMNMLYSDYSKTLSKYGVTSPDAYADLAKDWIYDDDVKAGDDKTAIYYHCIVK